MKRLVHLWILIPIAIMLVLIYWPGLNGPFVLDDGENISLDPAIALKTLSVNNIKEALLAGDSGPLKRPLASISFALNYYFAGSFQNTLPFKATNLAIHIINSTLIYFLVILLTRTPALATLTDRQKIQLAALTTALWAMHPIQLTNILYVVQRMNSLSALFVIAGLLVYVHGRQLLETKITKGFSLMVTGLLAGMIFGLMAKENAALLPLFALTIEFVFYNRNNINTKTRYFLWLFYSLVIAVPVIIFLVYLGKHPDYFLDTYATRNFSVSERMLTEARILWFYIRLILIPSVTELGLFHDDIALSTGLFSPFITFPAVVGLCALLIFALIKIKRHPLISFAILWFLAGHMLESSVFGLELAYEHRNYLPSFGILFVLSYFLILLPDKIQSFKKIWSPLLFVLIFVVGFATWDSANAWGNIEKLANNIVHHHPHSPRANDFAARVSLAEKNDIRAAVHYTLHGLDAAPDEVGFYIDLQILLATLTADINDTLAKSLRGGNLNSSKIDILGLPDGIETKVLNNKIQLEYKKSTDNRIYQFLKNEPISVHAIVSLENLRRCIVNAPYTCRSLQNRALGWFAAASGNSHTSKEYKAIILSDAAVVYSHVGDFKHALEYASRAVQLAPDMLSYQLARTEYLIRTGHLVEAKKMLDRFGKEQSANNIQYAVNKITIQQLSDMYKNAARNMPHSVKPDK